MTTGLGFSKLLFWTSLSLALLHIGWGERCEVNNPSIKQTQVGFKNPPKYMVEVQNTCQTCPVIDVHVKCGNFSQALVNPRVFRVLTYNDCVVNSGAPLEPLQRISFNYSHNKYVMYPSTWYFQCE